MNTTFAGSAETAFSFLEDAGFRLTEKSSTLLRYESDKIFATVGWDPRSGEIEIFVGLKPKKGESTDAFSLTDIVSMQSPPLTDTLPFQVSDEGSLAPFLERLSALAQSQAQPTLIGDRMFFRRLKTFRNKRSQQLMQDMELRRIRLDADTAWRKHDFDKLIKLYTPVENMLSAAEKKKLAYARTRRI